MSDDLAKLKLFSVGIEVVFNRALLMDIQRRKHRKKRINKKWLKKYGTKMVPSNEAYMVNYEGKKQLVIHPEKWGEFKSIINL